MYPQSRGGRQEDGRLKGEIGTGPQWHRGTIAAMCQTPESRLQFSMIPVEHLSVADSHM